MAEGTDEITLLDICLEKCSIDDIHCAMSSQPTWKNATLLDGKTKLLDLISAMKDIEQLRSFLNEHVFHINNTVAEDSPVWPGFTLLHLAVMLSEQPKNASYYTEEEKFEPDLELIEECLNRGADVTAKDASGSTPLHIAFRHQRTRTIEKLLQFHHSTANPIDKENVSHLHIACASGNEDVVKKLLQSGADPNLRVLSHFDYRRGKACEMGRIHAGSTPLHIAVAGKNSKVARLLVENGADVNVTDDSGATPIHCLLVQGSRDSEEAMADILLSANLLPITLSGSGITHLHVASYFNHVDAVTRLLDLGADIEARLGCQPELNHFRDCYKNDKDGLGLYKYYGHLTALEMTVDSLSLDALELLIKRGADVLSESPNGRCPLYTMFNDDNGRMCLEVLARLMEDNDILAKRLEEEYGLTALHLACVTANTNSCKRLINSNVNVNAQLSEKALDWAGSTPLHIIVDHLCHEGHFNVLQITEILLGAGADISLCNANDQTPLHLMIPDMSRDDCGGETRRLMHTMMLNSTKDFRVNPTDKVGWSHFLLACFQNDRMVIEKFLEHGVDVNERVSLRAGVERGSSALHLLIRKTLKTGPPLEVATIDALLAHGADVNAQNADDDTVLHRIARVAPHRVDIFRRLFRAGADLRKLNARCETPFAVLLLSKKATLEVIELFIERDQGGFLVGPLCASGSRLDRTRIFDTLFKSCDIAKSDDTGRTAIHNIVSAAGFCVSKRVTVGEYSKLIARLCNMGCDIDAQDQSGKTALHLAAQFKNDKAITALLINGADVNIIDTFGKTAFTYAAGMCRYENIEERNRHNDVIHTFLIHLRKMLHFKLHVNIINRNIMSKVNVPPFEMVRFCKQVKKIRLLTFEEESVSFKPIDMLSETGVMLYALKASIRLVVDQFFQNINFHLQGNTEVIGLFQLQLRKAVKRIELIDPAVESLNQAVAFPFPETCSLIVLKYLNNCDLENLIHAMNT